MQLACVITLASKKVEVAFRGMERSLRATGCTLPLWVIPYNDERFALPANAQWLEDDEAKSIYSWLEENNAHPTLRKYTCLTRSNYLFVDSDVAFLKNPAQALKPYDGFVINCCHWMDSAHTLTPETQPFFQKLSTTYQKTLFNSGQFACDRALYTGEQLKAAAQKMPATCLHFPYHEQPALNYLVHAAGAPITSLTLPPHNIASSWAGHYLQRQPPFWTDESQMPYLLHWAGRKFSGEYAVDELFLKHLDPNERQTLIPPATPGRLSLGGRLKNFLRGVRDSFKNSF